MPDRVAHFVNGQWVLGGPIGDAADAAGFWTVRHIVTVVVLIVVALALLVYALRRFTVVHGQQAVILERLGVPRPHPLRPGLRFVPPLHAIVSRVSLQQIQVEQKAQVKTSDDAFIALAFVIRYSVQSDDASILAFQYTVAKPVDQMIWRVDNELRQIVSAMTMAELYAQKDQIAKRIVGDQTTNALSTGLLIADVVIEQPMPPKEVQTALNNKIAALARQEAAAAEAEAERRKRVGLATAESQSKALQGQGIAAERKAIAEGFRQSMELLREGLPDATEEQIMALLIQTTQSDMVVTAAKEGSTVIFMPVGMTNPQQLVPILPKDAQGAIRGESA